ncbi:hypothetical protein AGABI1DRAFT_115767 [Agaricus bisporus var. burnettii JB137-S8]|uniref:Uncharacterized protein n=1 Tax=Agaricus bisporus var. burnettii (strain JB137-S8 / ATCC MYA-4627 / FGSC 10392) TaxID=597362 RepID=K5VPM9_AGABU|nr:hypothetical protein AGABI2DRAFT_194409 [Agaricus bisporus var. bisporus H97]XP_007332878.1 uncharacterized protein AGABI1DRAFT_115767 [Agaricus bisporus var. burnettii JB137-S8]EKM76429.1 hypothetical protein AGABI1DRAFT_115767 [Agaricus bisporus var. burnettii JB137-S8]EKV44327.1 hypothetical protein AGABI2DRAFT_194409 [Agaricus bisporus var. bisporus H97]
MHGEGGKEIEERSEMVEQRRGRGGGDTEGMAAGDDGGREEQNSCEVGEGGGEVKMIRGVTISEFKPAPLP